MRGSFTATNNLLVGLDAVKQGIDSGVQFVDSRSPAEYSGENPGSNARGGKSLPMTDGLVAASSLLIDSAVRGFRAMSRPRPRRYQLQLGECG